MKEYEHQWTPEEISIATQYLQYLTHPTDAEYQQVVTALHEEGFNRDTVQVAELFHQQFSIPAVCQQLKENVMLLQKRLERRNKTN